MVGILFVTTMALKIDAVTFANVKKHSYFGTENEILFSMHTVFRIDDVLGLNKGERLFEVRLTLTGEDDPELTRLTDRIEEDYGDGTGWKILGRGLATCYNDISLAYMNMGDYSQALCY